MPDFDPASEAAHGCIGLIGRHTRQLEAIAKTLKFFRASN